MIEAIIIFGKGVQPDGTLPSLVEHELRYAALQCWRQPIQAIICSGDYWGLADKPNNTSEAEAMAGFVRRFVPATVTVLAETQSKDTIGNLLYSKQLIDQHGWKSLLLLSSVDHLPRIHYLAEHIFDHSYELSYHGHQHHLTAQQYLHSLSYERFARWYARWFFHRFQQHDFTDWQQHHFMYRPNLVLSLAKLTVHSRPIHR